MTKYYNEDFNAALTKNPDGHDANCTNCGECMPVGINGTFMPTKKDDPTNFQKAQFNIKERFGLLSDEDYNNENSNY